MDATIFSHNHMPSHPLNTTPFFLDGRIKKISFFENTHEYNIFARKTEAGGGGGGGEGQKPVGALIVS